MSPSERMGRYLLSPPVNLDPVTPPLAGTLDGWGRFTEHGRQAVVKPLPGILSVEDLKQSPRQQASPLIYRSLYRHVALQCQRCVVGSSLNEEGAASRYEAAPWFLLS